jgi:hypothetical protein
MSRASAGGRPGPSPTASLRIAWYAAVVLGGAPTVFGVFQALSGTESPMRLTLLLLWSTRDMFAGLPAAAPGLLRGILVAALVALTALLLVRLLGWAARRARAAELEPPRSSSAPARSSAGSAAGQTGAGQTARRRPAPGSTGADSPAGQVGAGPSGGTGAAPVVVVGAVTGTVGRAWFGGRARTVRSTSGPLRDGGQYPVVGRWGEDLVVLSP